MRRRLTAWLLRRAGGRMASEIERVLAYRICTECGSWRCPECKFLILNAWDHAPFCKTGASHLDAGA